MKRSYRGYPDLHAGGSLIHWVLVHISELWTAVHHEGCWYSVLVTESSNSFANILLFGPIHHDYLGEACGQVADIQPPGFVGGRLASGILELLEDIWAQNINTHSMEDGRFYRQESGEARVTEVISEGTKAVVSTELDT